MRKQNSNSPHRSFRLTYREEIHDDFEPGSILTHSGETLSLILKNWKLFGSIILIMTFTFILLVGLLSQSDISELKSAIDSGSTEFSSKNLGNFAKAGILLLSTLSTGGLSSSVSANKGLILIFVFLLIFLISTYISRHILAKKKISLRDALYNSMSPLFSTFLIFLIIFLEMIPIFLLIIFYNAAVETEFLKTPFYAFLFLFAACLMILLSVYLITSSIFALVAASAPGVYPLDALRSARSLVSGRRIKISLHLLSIIVSIALFFVLVMLPVILIDTFLKSIFSFFAAVPVISFFLLLTTCFSFVYISVYLYLFYRKLLNYDNN